MRALKRLTVRNILPPSLEPLHELALNLRWSWDPETRELFKAIDPGLWEQTHDPLRLLGDASQQRLAELALDHGFVQWVSQRQQSLHDYLQAPSWFGGQAQTQVGSISGVAYFSPEFGVTSSLPQYSGGLGILAGDHLKSASDLGVPIIGIGLFYKSGYFRQSLSRDAWQLEEYPVCAPDASPVTLLRNSDQTPVVIHVGLPNHRELRAQLWIAQVGRVPLVLMDTDIEANDPLGREVTDRLYGGGGETRLQQEMLLGIGGIRALRAFCSVSGTQEPNVFHTNEGHAGFLGIERIRELVQSNEGIDFDQALEATRANTVFTTHTPVPAGIDRFPVELIARYFGGDNAEPGIPVEKILELGREDTGEYFNMAMMGFRLSGRANGVSLLHGEVSRGMFAHMWPGFDRADIPITSITNGVHAPTWVATGIFDLVRDEYGVTDPDRIWEYLGDISLQRFWDAKRSLREDLVAMSRERVRQSWLERGAHHAELNWTDQVLDPDILTIGFARRVPSYKRLTLMLRDPDRLRSLLTHPTHPVQMVIAGKAHPADEGGKALIQQLVKFADSPDVRDRIVFLPNYDIGMATILYPGCDIWLNNPIRPLEASGTSGMKAALNGALNLSIMDGWWDEWFDGSNGWSIPTAHSSLDSDSRDDFEAKAMYDLIESDIAPKFYRRGEDQLPHDWLEMVRHTLRTLGPKVLATRMVKEYAERLYAPAAIAGAQLAAENFRGARELAQWKQHVRDQWPNLSIEHVESDAAGSTVSLGETLPIRTYVHLAGLSPTDLVVEAVFGHVDSHDDIEHAQHVTLLPESDLGGNRWIYSGVIPLEQSGSFGYSIRITPSHPHITSTADLGLQVVPAMSANIGPSGIHLR